MSVRDETRQAAPSRQNDRVKPASRPEMARTIEGDGFRLVPWRPDHFAPFSALQADPAIMAAMVQEPQDRLAAWREMAAFAGHWTLKGFGHYALETDGFAGYAGLWQPPEWPQPELTYVLLPSARGRGIATRAARAILGAAAAAGISPVVSYLDPGNIASRRVMERLGATYRGRLRLWAEFDVWRHALPDLTMNGLEPQQPRKPNPTTTE